MMIKFYDQFFGFKTFSYSGKRWYDVKLINQDAKDDANDDLKFVS